MTEKKEGAVVPKNELNEKTNILRSKLLTSFNDDDFFSPFLDGSKIFGSLLGSFFNEFDSVFSLVNNKTTVPSDTIENTDDKGNLVSIEKHFAFAGHDPKDIEIVLDDDVMTVNVNKKEEKVNSGKFYVEKRISERSSRQSFRLPSNVIKDEISSSYSNGLLKIKLPIKNEVVETKKLPIKIEIKKE
jgi:HSP20 family protein